MSDSTKPFSGFGMQLDPDPMPKLVEPLEAMIEMPTNFDWVSLFLILEILDDR